MRFTAEHRFDARPEAVARALADAGFYRDLELPDVAVPEVLAADGVGPPAGVRLRYEFTGTLDPVARRLLGGRRLTWIQEVHLDRGGRGGTLRFFAEAAPGRLHGDAAFSLRAEDGGTVRHLEGSLVVGVPVVGRAAEPRIVAGLLTRLDVEAAALQAHLDGSGRAPDA